LKPKKRKQEKGSKKKEARKRKQEKGSKKKRKTRNCNVIKLRSEVRKENEE